MYANQNSSFISPGISVLDFPIAGWRASPALSAKHCRSLSLTKSVHISKNNKNKLLDTLDKLDNLDINPR